MIKPESTYIYALKDPYSLELRYIGKSNNPKKRFSKHIRDCFNNLSKNSHKQNWIRKLLGDNPDNYDDRPILEILEKVSYENWEIREKYWIKEFRKRGYNLTNIEDGGGGFSNPDLCKVVAKINYVTNEIEEVYESISEAGRRNGYSSNGRISDCCHGRVQKSKGYKWRFLDSNGEIIDNSYKKFKSKKVAKFNLELELIKIYPTLYSVSEYAYDFSNVYKVCKGETKSCDGYIWRFLDDVNNIIEPKISYKRKTVSKYDLNGLRIKTYLNTEIAAIDNGLKDGQSIRDSINKANRLSSCGYKWCYNNY